VFPSKDSFVAHRQARITVDLGPRHQWCKQDRIHETKTKTKITRPRPKPP